MVGLTPKDQLQYFALGVISLGVMGSAVMLRRFGSIWFEPYFGQLDPLVAIALITLTGILSLGFLYARGWFDILVGQQTLQGVALSAFMATLFAIAVIFIDISLGFPKDINVPLPQSLLFYPTMACVAEVVFHLLPLAGLLGLGSLTVQAWTIDKFLTLGLPLIALLEPIFQAMLKASGPSNVWLDVYVVLHIWGINLAQLYIFRRYDFVSMYAFRLIYYLHWHILWGYWRLEWLF